MTSSSGLSTVCINVLIAAAAPVVMMMSAAVYGVPKRRASDAATVSRTEAYPALSIYPCRSGALFRSVSANAKRTPPGHGAVGLPMLKSNTFSAPYTLFSCSAFSKAWRMAEVVPKRRLINRETSIFIFSHAQKAYTTNPPQNAASNSVYLR